MAAAVVPSSGCGLALLLRNSSVVPVYRLYCCEMHTRQMMPPKPIGLHAQEILQKNFSDDSLRRLDVPKLLLKAVREAIEAESVTHQTFSDIQSFTFNLLEERTLSSFISSPYYLSFIEGDKARRHEQSNPPMREEDLDPLYQQVKLYQSALTTVSTALSRALESQATAIRNQIALANAFSECSELLAPMENSSLVELSQGVSKLIGRLESIQSRTNRTLVKNVENPFLALLKEDIPAACAQKRKQESKGKAEIIEETCLLLHETQEKCERQVLQGMCSILEDYYLQYEQGHTLFHRLLPKMIQFRTETEIIRFKEENEKYHIGTKLEISKSMILKEAKLEKKGAIRRNWTFRWFILKSGYLFYLNNKNDKILKGFIHLKNCTIKPCFNKKKPHCLEITTALRNFLIHAPSEKDAKDWLHAIKNATIEEELKRLEETHKLQLESLSHSQAEEYLDKFLRSAAPAPIPPHVSIETPALMSKRSISCTTVTDIANSPTKKKKRPKRSKTDVPSDLKVRKSKKKSLHKKTSSAEPICEDVALNAPSTSGYSKQLPSIPAPAPTPPLEHDEVPLPLPEHDTEENLIDNDGDDGDGDEDDTDEDFDDDGEEQENVSSTQFKDHAKSRMSRKAIALDLLNQMEEEERQMEEEEEKKKEEKKAKENSPLQSPRSNSQENSEDNMDVLTLNDSKTLLSGETGSGGMVPSQFTGLDHDTLPEDSEGLPMSRSSIGSTTDILFKQGYLMKKGAKRRNWTTRWFILRYNHLAYYKNPGDSEPKGNLTLSDCRVEKATNDKKPYCFAIISPLRTYLVSAKDAALQEEWISVIERAIPTKDV